MTILEASNLSKQYPGEELPALSNVDFKVEAGEFVVIVGPSGSGKSTLLHLLGGVDKPTSGHVMLHGTDLTTLSEKQLAVLRRRQVGLIYQSYNLLPNLTVVENMTLPADLDGQTVDPARLADLLKQLGLQAKANVLPSQLSGGQQQRVAIGRALLARPAIILADEPTGNLDQRNSEAIMQLLHAANVRDGQTVVIITHDPRIAAQASRVVTLVDGHLVEGGSGDARD